MALPVMTALVSHAAFAQFSLVSRTGQLEARPGKVIDLAEFQLEAGLAGNFYQDSYDLACSPPRCIQNFYQNVDVSSYGDSKRLFVGTSVYASIAPVDLVNKAEVSLTFDVAAQTDVLLTLIHGVTQDSSTLAPFSNSYSFGRLLGDGSFESFTLPTLSNGATSTEKRLNLTLQAGRHVMTSRIAFNSSLSFPDGLPPSGWMIESGLAVGLMAGRRKVSSSNGRSPQA